MVLSFAVDASTRTELSPHATVFMAQTPHRERNMGRPREKRTAYSRENSGKQTTDAGDSQEDKKGLAKVEKVLLQIPLIVLGSEKTIDKQTERDRRILIPRRRQYPRTYPECYDNLQHFNFVFSL